MGMKSYPGKNKDDNEPMKLLRLVNLPPNDPAQKKGLVKGLLTMGFP